MDTIDLDAIMKDAGAFSTHGQQIRWAMKEAIHQTLVLASEKAETTEDSAGNKIVDKQSILDVEELIK